MIDRFVRWGERQLATLTVIQRYWTRTRTVRRIYGAVPWRGLNQWIRGWQADQAAVYGFDRNDRSLYLSDWHHWRSRRVNGSAIVLTHDKVLFERVFGRSLHVPRLLGEVSGGTLRSIQWGPGYQEPVRLREIMSAVSHGVVAKPRDTAGGREIVVLLKDADGSMDFLTWNGERMETDAAERRLCAERNRMVCEFARQAEYSRRIYGRTTNTIRVLTMVDPADGSVFIPAAVQRIGSRASEPVDNWSKGGIAAPVDLATGALGRGAVYPERGERLRWVDDHPDTGERIIGAQVANWNQIQRGLIDAVRLFPILKVVGWDVVSTDTGFSVLEGNSGPNVNLMQLGGGLLADDRVRRVFESAGVIRRRKGSVSGANVGCD